MSVDSQKQYAQQSQNDSNKQHKSIQILLQQLKAEFGLFNVEEDCVLRRHSNDFVANFLQIVDPSHEKFVVDELTAVIACNLMDVFSLALAHENYRGVEIDSRHHFQSMHDPASQKIMSEGLSLVDKEFDDVSGQHSQSFSERSGHHNIDDLLIRRYSGCV